MTKAAERRAIAQDALAIAVVFALVCALLAATGFDHVSDDDFARVTIAQAFAARPKLDPSGTSWLPFPFWALGGTLAIVGRSLEAARVVSVVFAAAASPLLYLAMRAAGASRVASAAGSALALTTPWALWLGASTVPELYTAALTAAAAVLASARRPRAPFFAGAALLAACLSRYEPWALAPILAATFLLRAARGDDRARLVGAAALACAGPLLWMAWNAHAHDDALHFLHRVARYRRAIGQGAGDDVAGALLFYPRLFVTTRPELVLGAVLAVPALSRSRELRARWSVPLACAAAQIAFLAYGALADGAPTHHAERPLLAAFMITSGFVADGLGSLFALAPRAFARVAAIAVTASTLASARPLLDDAPGRGPSEDRRGAVARGRALRDAAHLTVTPCAYEHFALVAAYGAPERVTILPAAPGASACPDVTTGSKD